MWSGEAVTGRREEAPGTVLGRVTVSPGDSTTSQSPQPTLNATRHLIGPDLLR